MYTYTIILLCVYIHTYIYIYTHNITCHLLSFGRSSACSQRVSPRGRGHLQLDPVHVLAALLEDISFYIYYTYMDIYIYIYKYTCVYIYIYTYIHIYVYTYVCMYVCMYIYIYIHNTHVYALLSLLLHPRPPLEDKEHGALALTVLSKAIHYVFVHTYDIRLSVVKC